MLFCVSLSFFVLLCVCVVVSEDMYDGGTRVHTLSTPNKKGNWWHRVSGRGPVRPKDFYGKENTNLHLVSIFIFWTDKSDQTQLRFGTCFGVLLALWSINVDPPLFYQKSILSSHMWTSLETVTEKNWVSGIRRIDSHLHNSQRPGAKSKMYQSLVFIILAKKMVIGW